MITVFVWVARLCFITQLAGLTYLALAAPGRAAQLGGFIPWDKASHFLAFYMVGCTGFAAFPRLPIIFILVALFGQSALLELVQPYFGRSASVSDLIANVAGVGAAAAPLLAYRLRERASSPVRIG